MNVIVIDKERWRESFSASAHRATFGKLRNPEHERIDYALLAVKDKTPVGYATVREIDEDTVYWPYGGVFPAWHGTIVASRVFERCAEKQGLLSRRLRFLVERNNTSMLRLALKADFLVCGTRASGDDLFVELEKEFS